MNPLLANLSPQSGYAAVGSRPEKGQRDDIMVPRNEIIGTISMTTGSLSSGSSPTRRTGRIVLYRDLR